MNNQQNTLMSHFKSVYNRIREFYFKNPQNLISIISDFLLDLIIRFILLSIDTIFLADDYSAQYIIFLVSTWLLVTGIEIGYTKFIFNKIDNKTVKISDLFNYFDILPRYILGAFLNLIIIFASILPAIIFVYYKYGPQLLTTIFDSINDPYYKELIDSYFNSSDVIIIFSLILIPLIFIQLRLCFFNFYIIDKEDSVINAMKKSWIISEHYILNILIYFLIFVAFNLLGMLTIVGIFFTAPISYLFFCIYFRFVNNNLKKHVK